MTDRIRPAMFRWKEVDVQTEGGELRRAKVMVPLTRFARLCERQFELDEDYPLGPVEGVTSRSRGGFFASVHRAWDSLPETDERFPSEEHLRKRSLVEAGWATHTQTVLDTAADAERFWRGLRKIDSYAVIKVSGTVVDVWVAKSIAAGQIDNEEWKGVKDRALNWMATLSGTTPSALEQAGRES